VTITDPLPANTSFVSADSGGTNVDGVATWSELTVPTGTPGVGGSINVHLRVNIADALKKKVDSIVDDGLKATSAEGPSTTGSQVVTPLAQRFAFGLSPATQLDGARHGSSLTYHVTVTNEGFHSGQLQVDIGRLDVGRARRDVRRSAHADGLGRPGPDGGRLREGDRPADGGRRRPEHDHGHRDVCRQPVDIRNCASRGPGGHEGLAARRRGRERPGPNGTAQAAFTDDAAKPDALTFAGAYKVMFLAFPFEEYGSATQKVDLLTRVKSFFGA
jgi:hypothetical protein